VIHVILIPRLRAREIRTAEVPNRLPFGFQRYLKQEAATHVCVVDLGPAAAESITVERSWRGSGFRVRPTSTPPISVERSRRSVKVVELPRDGAEVDADAIRVDLDEPYEQTTTCGRVKKIAGAVVEKQYRHTVTQGIVLERELSAELAASARVLNAIVVGLQGRASSRYGQSVLVESEETETVTFGAELEGMFYVNRVEVWRHGRLEAPSLLGRETGTVSFRVREGDAYIEVTGADEDDSLVEAAKA
jgi:hypothetical protein